MKGDSTRLHRDGGLVPIVITTQWKGVFFGYALPDKLEADEIWLMRARNCLYWDKSLKGVVGLAAQGPTAQCRIGPPAGAFFRGITAVFLCESQAAERWENAPWAE